MGQFRKAFANLPKEIQNQAREAYLKFKKNPWHSGLGFKQVHTKLPV